MGVGGGPYHVVFSSHCNDRCELAKRPGLLSFVFVVLFCSIRFIYRGSFHVRSGLGEASCAERKVSLGISPRVE